MNDLEKSAKRFLSREQDRLASEAEKLTGDTTTADVVHNAVGNAPYRDEWEAAHHALSAFGSATYGDHSAVSMETSRLLRQSADLADAAAGRLLAEAAAEAHADLAVCEADEHRHGHTVPCHHLTLADLTWCERHADEVDP